MASYGVMNGYGERTSVAIILNILLVDDRPETASFLTEFLLARGHRVLVVATAKDALATISRRRTSGAVDLVISELTLPGGSDGLTLLRELRASREPLELAVCSASTALYPSLVEDAVRLQLRAVLSKPCDVQRIDEMLVHVSWNRAAPSSAAPAADIPFFGTGRMSRSERAEDPRGARSAAPGSPTPPPHADAELPFDEADRAHAPAPPSTRPGSGRDARPPSTRTLRSASGVIQREVTATPTPRPPAAIPLAPEVVLVPKPGSLAGDKPLAPVTTRLRRSITGTERIERTVAPEPAVATTGVACAICGKPFVVIVRPAAYSVVCVHCGQLNRVDPAH
jgi:CheY-like chemotaxis protein